MKRPLLVLTLCATPVLAQAPAGSNMGLSQYPAHTCKKPQGIAEIQKPKPPPDNLTETQAIGYNRQVDAYNRAMRAHNDEAAAFTSCINAYIANGNADMRRIREALDAAVMLANAP